MPGISQSYKIRKPLTGKKQVVFACPSCEVELKSPLEDAGTADHCPNCSAGFVVPGSVELKAERDAEAFNQRAREESAERKREDWLKQEKERIQREGQEYAAAGRLARERERQIEAKRPRTAGVDVWSTVLFLLFLILTVIGIVIAIDHGAVGWAFAPLPLLLMSAMFWSIARLGEEVHRQGTAVTEALRKRRVDEEPER